MQAGDSLQFIRPFIETIETGNESVLTLETEDIRIFARMTEKYLNVEGEHVHIFEVLEESGPVTVIEVSYTLEMPDKSYLHVLLFSHQNEQGVLDAGIAVNEHFEDGYCNGGYLYQYTPDGISRSSCPPDPEPDVNEAAHFSISDMYADKDILFALSLSEDEDARGYAFAEQKRQDVFNAYNAMLESQGLDDLPPHPGEMRKLITILEGMQPFPLNQWKED